MSRSGSRCALWTEPRSHRGLLALLSATAVLVLLLAPPAARAATQRPILGTAEGQDTLVFTRGEDGTSSASLEVTNPSEQGLSLALEGLGDVSSCRFTLRPDDVPANRTVSVTVETACTLPEAGTEVALVAQGRPLAELAVEVEEAAQPVDVLDVLQVFAVALAAAIVVALLAGARRPHSPASKGVAIGNRESAARVGLRDELPGTDATWSFTDSWATTISAVGTVFVALLGASDLLTAVLGEEPEGFLATVLVAGAIAAFLTGAAPLVAKAVGTSLRPSVLGVLVGGVLTMTGVSGQVFVVGQAFATTGADEWLQRGAWALAWVGGAGILWYGGRSLLLLLRDAFRAPDPPPPVPLDQLATTAAVVVAARRLKDDEADPAEWIAHVAATAVEMRAALEASGAVGESATTAGGRPVTGLPRREAARAKSVIL